MTAFHRYGFKNSSTLKGGTVRDTEEQRDQQEECSSSRTTRGWSNTPREQDHCCDQQEQVVCLSARCHDLSASGYDRGDTLSYNIQVSDFSTLPMVPSFFAPSYDRQEEEERSCEEEEEEEEEEDETLPVSGVLLVDDENHHHHQQQQLQQPEQQQTLADRSDEADDISVYSSPEELETADQEEEQEEIPLRLQPSVSLFLEHFLEEETSYCQHSQRGYDSSCSCSEEEDEEEEVKTPMMYAQRPLLFLEEDAAAAAAGRRRRRAGKMVFSLPGDEDQQFGAPSSSLPPSLFMPCW